MVGEWRKQVRGCGQHLARAGQQGVGTNSHCRIMPVSDYSNRQIKQQRTMDNFFAKKGITLSRNPPAPQPSREQLLRTSQPHPSQPAPQPYLRPPPPHYLPQPPPPRPPPSYEHLPAPPLAKFAEKASSLQVGFRGRGVLQLGPPPPKHSQWKYVPSFPARSRQSGESQEGSMDVIPPPTESRFTNRSLEDIRPATERTMRTDPNEKDENKLSAYLRTRKLENQELSPEKLGSVSRVSLGRESERDSNRGRESQRMREVELVRDSESLKDMNGTRQIQRMKENEKMLRVELEQLAVRNRTQEDKIRALTDERDRLSFQVGRASEGRSNISDWLLEKHKLYSQITEKNDQIRHLQTQLSSTDQQHKSKLLTLEYDHRRLQATKNRLEIECKSLKDKLSSQTSRNEKTREQMNKLIFFEEDLIHASDYDRLKRQLEEALTENSLLFQEHQNYIIEVADSRRKHGEAMEGLRQEVGGLRQELAGQRARMQAVAAGGEDKMRLIKLQNELNFIRKKAEEQLELVLQRERELQTAKAEIQQLHQELKRSQSNQTAQDELTLQQIRLSISNYETRIEQLNSLLETKQTEIDQHKQIQESVSAELRSLREEKHISALKDKNSQNSLRNQVENLQRTLHSQIQSSTRKIHILEDSIARKSKEIAEKDKFIKDFLLSRTKQLEKDQATQIVHSLQEYFASPLPHSPPSAPPTPPTATAPVEISQEQAVTITEAVAESSEAEQVQVEGCSDS